MSRCTCNTNLGIDALRDVLNRDPDCPVHGDGANTPRPQFERDQASMDRLIGDLKKPNSSVLARRPNETR